MRFGYGLGGMELLQWLTGQVLNLLTVQYTEDGVNFEVVCVLEDIPPAGGAYITDKFEDPANGKGFSWGLCHYGRSDWNFLIRFDCDLRKQGKAKRRDWKYFPHYSTVRDVMQNPKSV